MPTLKRTVLVTGASSGIGRAIAEHLLSAGHDVIGVSRDCKKLTWTLTNFTAVELDFSLLNQLPKQLLELSKRFPSIDAVVFSAGKGLFGSLEQFSYENIAELMAVNFTSQVFLTRALLPSLKRKTQSDLIYIGSEAALKGSRQGTAYCASKFALRGFTQALREECGKSQTRVCLINPGMVKTPFFDELSFAPGDGERESILPEDVAEAVLYVLDSRPHIVIDEINLSTLNKVVKFKTRD